ncbi:MAG: S41 family peptidase, partial [Candidatus Kapaibacterium sp.]
YRGKKVEFSAYVRTDMAGPASHAQLWMRVDREHNRVALLKNMDANPIVSKDWQRYSIEADIPESAEIIRLGLVMIGEGEVYFDDVQFTAPGVDPKSDDSRLQNGGFEEYANSDFVPGWLLQRSVERAGYDATQTNRGAYAGEMCLKISSDPSTRIDFPSPGEQYIDEAARDIYFAIPLSLYVDTATTLPRGNLAIDYERYLPGKDFRADGRDRASRLATVIVMWNVIRHFHSFELDEARLDAAFRLALAEAAEDKSRVDFLRTLQKFGSNLDDSQSRVWYGFSRERYGIPLLWTYSNGNLIVTNTRGNTGLHPGDIITEINDQPVDNIIREKGQYISASAPDFRNVRALAELRAGPKNSIVKIKAKSGGKLREIALRRSILLTQLNESRPDEITELDDDIFYVDMNRVRDEEFQDNLDRLKSARGIIFDCRGAATLSEYVLGFFLDKTVRNVAWDIPIFTAPYQRLVSHSYIHTPIAAIDTQLTSDVVFLADARSIGYSEVILAMADHYGIGEIVGHSGGGIAGETYPVRLPGEYAISLTAMKPVGPDGNVLRGKNFKPDYEVYITSESARNGVDPFIEKALEILK